MAIYNIAIILKNPQNDAQFLLVKQTRPPKFGNEEYDSFADSDLWDLPSTTLNLLEGQSEPQISIEGSESCSEKIELRKFDVDLAIDRVLKKTRIEASECEKWRFWKFVEEAEFGPGLPIHTVFLVGNFVVEDQNFQDLCLWMSAESCMNLLSEVKPRSDRVGPLVVIGLLNDASQPKTWKIPRNLNYQEYPPGVTILPMHSNTLRPFSTTNLTIFAPHNQIDDSANSGFAAYGDALIVDPGCHSQLHEELRAIVASLPEKLVVFVTHHHRDHINGLSVVQQCNPNAILLAHEKTMSRIGKDVWSLGHTSISGGEEICIGGQRLNVISAPGHTDGHMGLLHVCTQSLIVGDHCVGQGSSFLDINSGGNVKEYIETAYRFMNLSPHVLIPMHGRVNLWPNNMLCANLKNRRDREATILRAIQNGASTLFEIVASVYADVDRRLWISASSNVRLHVDHLAQQDHLPKDFSIQKFQKTCHLRFFLRWVLAYLASGFRLKCDKVKPLKLLVAGAVASFAAYLFRKKQA